MEKSEVVAALGALAQTTRLSIYQALAGAGRAEISAGALAEQLEIPAATLSFHLRELSRARLVSARQEARFIFYSANRRTMKTVLDYLAGNTTPLRSAASKPKARTAKAAKKPAARAKPSRR